MSSSRYVGRHGGAGRRRFSLPSVAGSGATRAAVKSVAGIGIVLGSGAFVIAPSSGIGAVDVDPSLLGAEQSLSATELLADRDAASGTQATAASRSVERGAPAAITAPGKASSQSGTGELGIEPVAKPKPKPEPEPETETTQAEPEETEATQEVAPAPEPEPSTSTESESQESQESQESTAPATSGVQTDGYAAEAAEMGLGPNASRVYSAVRNQFPDMTDIGGYRAGDPGDHGAGRAVDIMVTGSRGDQVAAWLQQNAGSLNIKYLIWEQRIWHPGGTWEYMEDRGSTTANHYDHVHVSVY